jgi:NCS1 family nucleobase:cation symporter-1
MAEEDLVGEGDNNDVKRRTTFTPPPEDAEFPERLGELSDDDIQAAKRASEAAAAHQPAQASEPDASQGTYQVATPPPAPEPQPAEPVGPVIPPAPTRSSLGDEEIMAKFRDGAIPTTEGMMAALESQLSLREEEDARFGAWEDSVRAVVSEEEARHIIAPARETFGGLPPLPEPEPVRDSGPDVEPEVLVEPTVNPLLASMATDTDELQLVAADSAGEPEASALEAPATVSQVSDFDAVVSNQDATSPETSQWPLVVEEPVVEEPVAEDTAEDFTADTAEVTASEDGEVAETSATADDEVERAPVAEEPSLVSAGVAVGTDTVNIRDVVATKEVPVEPFNLNAVEKERWFSFDRVGAEPAADVNRTAGALQLFWTWWAASIPLAGIILGAWLMAIGNSLLQAVVATVAGVVIGALPLIAGTVVGIRWGVPALIASRSAFGLAGNIAPAALMLLVRLAVSAFFLWAAVWIASGMYVQANLWRLDRVALDVILATIAVVVVGALVMVGRRFVSLMLWVSAGLSLVASAVLIVLTWDIPTRASLAAGSWSIPLLVSSASVIAAIVMILWAQSGADVARFGRPGKAVAGVSMVTLAALLPPIVLIGWGVLLGASGRAWRSGVIADPFNALLSLAPDWYPIPALVLLAIPLLGLAALALHSSSYALMSLGFAMTRYVAAALVTVVAAGVVFAVLMVLGDPTPYLVDVIRVVGVVVAAWTGVFVADVMTRRVSLSPSVLLGSSGSYPAVRVAPLAGFVVAIGAGWGFTVSAQPVFSWLGYAVGPLADLGLVNLAPYQLGVAVALVVAFVVTALAGIRGGVLTGAEKAQS